LLETTKSEEARWLSKAQELIEDIEFQSKQVEAKTGKRRSSKEVTSQINRDFSDCHWQLFSESAMFLVGHLLTS
jgi:hypothetical protein